MARVSRRHGRVLLTSSDVYAPSGDFLVQQQLAEINELRSTKGLPPLGRQVSAPLP